LWLLANNLMIPSVFETFWNILNDDNLFLRRFFPQEIFSEAAQCLCYLWRSSMLRPCEKVPKHGQCEQKWCVCQKH
jgi:hypothetical protein